MKQIVAALLEARRGFRPLRESGRNQHTRSTYATMEDVWAAVLPALAANGLVVQFTTLEAREIADHVPKSGDARKGWTVRVEGRLLHESGEMMTAEACAAGYDAQDKGLLIAHSCARRLVLIDLLGVPEGAVLAGQGQPRGEPGRRGPAEWPPPGKIETMIRELGEWCRGEAERRNVEPGEVLAERAEGIRSLKRFQGLEPGSVEAENLLGVLVRAHRGVG